MIASVTFSLMYGHILKAGWPAGTVFSLTAFFAASTLPFSMWVQHALNLGCNADLYNPQCPLHVSQQEDSNICI